MTDPSLERAPVGPGAASAGSRTDEPSGRGEDPEHPPSEARSTSSRSLILPAAQPSLPSPRSGFQSVLRWLRRNLIGRGDPSVRQTLEELIEDRAEAELPLRDDERMLLANILTMQDQTAADVMVPRVDIVAVGVDAGWTDVVDSMTRSGHSRLPVYRETLDDVVGVVHLKDVVAWRDRQDTFQLAAVVRPPLFVPPSMELLLLLVEMRVKRCHIALVVDEFGGIDGLLTIEDVIGEIVGELHDEHWRQERQMLVEHADGSIDADARAPIDLLRSRFPDAVTEEACEEIDTLGGFVVSLAGRVPKRGEIIHHPAGLDIEVVEADPRRMKRLRFRAVPPGGNGSGHKGGDAISDAA